MIECESSTRTKLPQPRKPELFNTKVVHKVNFRSPSSKVATFQFQSSTRSAPPQLQLTSRKLRMRGPVSLMSGEKKLAGRSVDFRETFADLTPNIRENPAGSCAQLAPTASKLPEAGFCWLGGCFCSGVFLRRPSGCAFSDQLYSAGILRALPVDTHGSSLQLPVSKPHKTFAENKLTFATPFAELSRRSTLRPKGRPLHSSIQRPFGRLSYPANFTLPHRHIPIHAALALQLCQRNGPQESQCTGVLKKRFLFAESHLC